MNALLYHFAILGSMAAIELLFLRQWFGRRSLAVCIICGAITSGILGTAILWIAPSLGLWAYDTRTVQTAPDMFFTYYCLVPIFQTLMVSGIALIPAGLTAIIYRSFRSKK